MAMTQYWQSVKSGEIWAVQLDREGGEVKGVCGPLPLDVPANADDGDFDFDAQSESCDYFQGLWDDFRKSTLHPSA